MFVAAHVQLQRAHKHELVAEAQFHLLQLPDGQALKVPVAERTGPQVESRVVRTVHDDSPEQDLLQLRVGVVEGVGQAEAGLRTLG